MPGERQGHLYLVYSLHSPPVSVAHRALVSGVDCDNPTGRGIALVAPVAVRTGPSAIAVAARHLDKGPAVHDVDVVGHRSLPPGAFSLIARQYEGGQPRQLASEHSSPIYSTDAAVTPIHCALVAFPVWHRHLSLLAASGWQARWLPSRLIPHRHHPRAELQPAQEHQVDTLR